MTDTLADALPREIKRVSAKRDRWIAMAIPPRGKLCEAIMAGNNSEETRLEKVHAAAIADFNELRAELAAMTHRH